MRSFLGWTFVMAWFGIVGGEIEEDYPTSVPVFNIRKQSDGKFPVESGLIVQLGMFPENICSLVEMRQHTTKRVSRKELKELLQCAPTEPDLDDHTGSISMARHMPISRKTLELIAVWAETHCMDWTECQDRLKNEFLVHRYPSNFNENGLSVFRQFRLLRTINGSLYDDWPFGRDRLDAKDGIPPTGKFGVMHARYMLWDLLAMMVNDLPDTVFLMGGEQSFLPWNFPVPGFANAARLEYNNIPWPWPEALRATYDMYRRLSVLPAHLHAFKNESLIAKLTNQLPWDNRIEQAAYFGTWSGIRQFAFEAYRTAPDLFDMSFTLLPFQSIRHVNPELEENDITVDRPNEAFHEVHKSHHPSGDNHNNAHPHSPNNISSSTSSSSGDGRHHFEKKDSHQQKHNKVGKGKGGQNRILHAQEFMDMGANSSSDSSYHHYEMNIVEPGSAKPLIMYSTGRQYQPGHYKYVIVMLAMEGDATSGRLIDLLAFSGAVVLITESPYRWHFSARLKPWVHYVPISYSGADLVRKVAWLKAHDDLARQIAENGRNFARSYLRFEDNLCYALHAVEALVGCTAPDALKPFYPKLLSGQNCV